jgi:hypothetical protein
VSKHDSVKDAFLLRQEFSVDDFDDSKEPDFDKGLSGAWNGFKRVGQDPATNGAETGKRACGAYFGVDFCEHVELLVL